MNMHIPENILNDWQDLIDLTAQIFEVPAALIMKLSDPYIEVLTASKADENPYKPGNREQVWNSGLYCERVIRSKEVLAVPNALEDDAWKENPDIQLNMISYLGYPIMLPDDEVFGTICVLDTAEHAYAPSYRVLLGKFRDMMQHDLELMHMNQVLGDTARRVTEYLGELQHLRGIVSMCSYCKSIKTSQGEWQPVETYLIGHPNAQFSHGVCPACMKKHL